MILRTVLRAQWSNLQRWKWYTKTRTTKIQDQKEQTIRWRRISINCRANGVLIATSKLWQLWSCWWFYSAFAILYGTYFNFDITFEYIWVVINNVWSGNIVRENKECLCNVRFVGMVPDNRGTECKCGSGRLGETYIVTYDQLFHYWPYQTSKLLSWCVTKNMPTSKPLPESKSIIFTLQLSQVDYQRLLRLKVHFQQKYFKYLRHVCQFGATSDISHHGQIRHFCLRNSGPFSHDMATETSPGWVHVYVPERKKQGNRFYNE